MPDRPGAARDEHRRAGEGAGCQPRRPVLRHRERPVCGDRRHPEAGSHVETDGIGQRNHRRDGQHHVLLGRTVRALMLGHEDPDAVADCEVGDTGADGVDDSGAVVVGDHLGELEVLAGARALAVLPVGGVDAGQHDAHPHLPDVGIGNLTVVQLKNRGISSLGVGDRLHETHNAMRGRGCSERRRCRRQSGRAVISPCC